MRLRAAGSVVGVCLWAGCVPQLPRSSGDGAVSAGADAGVVSFHPAVASVIQRRCLGCHGPGGISGLLLTDYPAVADRAEDVLRAVESRRMPPWGVESGGDCQRYLEPRWLEPDEIDLIRRWVLSGTPRGQGTEPLSPRQAPAPLPDATELTMMEPYQPNARAQDDYRCFILDPGLAADAFLTGYDVRPGVPSEVHHIILYTLDSALAESQARLLDEREPGPGYTCFGTSNVSDSRPVVGWAPGVTQVTYPPDTGVRLRANRRLVMQVHYNLLQGSLPDQTGMRLQLKPTVAREAFVYLAADLTMSVAAGQALAPHAFSVRPSQLGIPVGVFIHGVFPHMHQRGRTLRLDVEHAGELTCAADVQDWDFSWQQFYFYERPLYLYPDDQLQVRCGFDTRADQQPVRWGEGTSDEMCLVGLYVTLF